MKALVTRVARAIITARAGSEAAEYAFQFNNANWREALRQARAVILAMRPDIEMFRVMTYAEVADALDAAVAETPT